MTITQLPTAPQEPDAPVVYVLRADGHVDALPQFIGETNVFANDLERDADTASLSAVIASDGALRSTAFTNFKGNWSDLSGSLISGAGVRHDGSFWRSVNALADVTTSEPGLTLDWVVIPELSATNKAELDNPLLTAFSKNKIGSAVTWARSSIATYTNRYGRVRVSPSNSSTNLCLRSEEFDNATWSKAGASVSADADVAPDGTMTADRVIEDTSTGAHLIQQLSITTVEDYHTVSVFVKPSSRFRFRVSSVKIGSISISASFNLNDLTFTVGPQGERARLLDAGDGWFRCSLTHYSFLAGSNRVNIEILDDTGASSYTGDGSSFLLVWGAQFEAERIAGGYVATTAASASGSSSEGVVLPREEAKGWLREGGGDNLMIQTENFSLANWINGSSLVVTPNDVVSPDGTVTGSKFVATGTSAQGVNDNRQLFIMSIVPGTIVIASVWLRADETVRLNCRIDNFSGLDAEDFPVTLTTEWRRFVFKRVFTLASVSGGGFIIGFQNVPYVAYAWGAQVEKDVSEVSSYMPNGVSIVSRDIDVITVPISNNVPLQPYSFTLSFRPGSLKTTEDRLFDLPDGIKASVSSSGSVSMDSGDRVVTSTNVVTVDTEFYFSATVDAAATKLYLNGSLVAISTTSESVNVDGTGVMHIGDRAAGDFPFFGHITGLRVYDVGLSADQNKALPGV